MLSLPAGVHHWPQKLDRESQKELLNEIREKVKQAPLFTPKMPRTGKELSVRMTNFGQLGWVTDKEQGYRYQKHHPDTGKPWPEIPKPLLDLWDELSGPNRAPQACLVNFYTSDAKMGMHQDRDEQVFDAPVLSISLGDECLFRVGGNVRGGKTTSIRLLSGDVMMLADEARMAFHGVDRIYPHTSDLLKAGGRINLTLRVVR